MNLAQIAVERQAVSWFLVFLVLVGGAASFFQLGWLEDPEFTVKTAVVTTSYPGAKPEEVIFTSGGTEANNLAVKGILAEAPKERNHIVTTNIEHNAVQPIASYWKHHFPYLELIRNGHD